MRERVVAQFFFIILNVIYFCLSFTFERTLDTVKVTQRDEKKRTKTAASLANISLKSFKMPISAINGRYCLRIGLIITPTNSLLPV